MNNKDKAVLGGNVSALLKTLSKTMENKIFL